MTPTEIAKLTEQANRAKALMAKSSKSGETAKVVLDRYEQTLATFDAHIAKVGANDAALTSMMAAMGNAAPVLEGAFQDGGVDAKADVAADGKAVSADPAETAHLPKTNAA